jgi:hypothetical protein
MAGKVNVPIGVAIQGLANTQKQLQTLTRGINGVGKTAGVAAIGFAAFVGAVKSADFAAQAISGARDLERNLMGVQTVFEDLTPRMTDFARTASSMGLGMTDAAKSVTFIGSVLKQSGFEISETADLTERLVGLATDLSITYGYDVQEALMGMTALFRGEYDPIEKFGVAMKQSEINSELAAKGMGNLEGAQRRLAEQQVRVQLLFERAADAQGAMERGAGTLAVEQLKLAASFENVRDTVATSMLPVLGGIFADLQVSIRDLQKPLKEAFDAAAPAVERLAEILLPAMRDGFLFVIDSVTELMGIIERMLTPTTEVGEAITAVVENVESLFNTITGGQASSVDAWGFIEAAITFVANAIADVIRFIDITVIGFKTLGEMAVAFFTGDWSKLVNTDWGYQIRQQIELRDKLVESGIAMAKLYDNAKVSLKEIGDQTEVWNRPKGPKPAAITPPVVETKPAGPAAKDYVKDFFASLREEIAKEQARLKLERLGASESLIENILGSQGWEKVFARVIASGTKGIKTLQAQFNKTAAGIKELEANRKALEEEATKAIEKAQEAADKLQQAYLDAKEAADDFKQSIKETAQLDILPTIDVELGRFEEQIVTTFANIRQELSQGLIDGRIYQDDFNKLTAFVAAEQEQLNIVARNRDDLANRYSLSKALIEEYRSALAGSMQLSNLLGNIKSQTEARTVTETTKGVMRLGKSLREFEITVTRSFEETTEEVKGKTETILTGFRDMASKARAFGENLRKLRALGLDDQLFAQLIQAGVEAGGETAKALVDGGSATINEINSLFREIDALGADLGEEVATTLYGTGIDMADGLLAGIQSKQSQLETLARTMADAFNTAFEARIKVAVDVPVQAAQNAANAAQAAVPDIKQINLDALARINTLIANATAYLAKAPNAFEQIRAEDAISIYELLKADIMAGQNVDLSGIRPGMTTEALAAAAGKPNVYNNFNINVSTDATQSNAMVGQAIGNILTSYIQTGGQVAV